ncbi:hypothetical protein COU53_02650 [Candidatus Pacearchaeota archaeon CG10_big_fil_rev_8_21_14_0_10_30_48]|nr:MAG: hypothetical protein COU53_02650 [Candidatus Pacearchaeota archaeon CG10_big_fil_rev_8_21_14_0_10_30_48]
MRLNKKAQEEMVGFVLIVVIVAIIAVIFLGISLRNSGGDVGDESEKIGSFIDVVSQTTTKCEIPTAHFQDVGNLISKCSQGKLCDGCDGETCGTTKSACEVLKNTLTEAMKSSYVVSEGSYVKYYNLTLYYELDNELLIEPIIMGPQDNCLGDLLFNERPVYSGGEKIKLSLEVCFNN